MGQGMIEGQLPGPSGRGVGPMGGLGGGPPLGSPAHMGGPLPPLGPASGKHVTHRLSFPRMAYIVAHCLVMAGLISLPPSLKCCLLVSEGLAVLSLLPVCSVDGARLARIVDKKP
jgi:hypothetical protein